MSLFKPKEILNRFTELDIKKLKDRGFKTVFIDIDNTITAPNVGIFTDEAKKFVEDIKKEGIRPVIISNNTKKRVKDFINGYEVDWYYFALKPLPFVFYRACRKYDCKTNECAVIGDQLITDILGANLCGAYGIYSKQLQEKDTPLTKINRKAEKFIWRHILHEKM